jgi:hypothetical protein
LLAKTRFLATSIREAELFPHQARGQLEGPAEAPPPLLKLMMISRAASLREKSWP